MGIEGRRVCVKGRKFRQLANKMKKEEVPPLTYHSRECYEAQNLINDIEGNYNLLNKITPNSALQNNTSSVSLLLLNTCSDYMTPRREQIFLIAGKGATGDFSK
jgi:hypothetical protein